MQFGIEKNELSDELEMKPVNLWQKERIDLRQELNKFETCSIHESGNKEMNRHRHSSINFSKYRLTIQQNSKGQIPRHRFNPYQIPANIGECYIHQRSTQFGIPSHTNIQFLNQTHQQPISNPSSARSYTTQPLQGYKKPCRCCGQQPKQKLHACCRIDNLYIVNQSLGFYFTYIKLMFLMLLLIAIFLGPYSLKELVTNCTLDVNCMQVYGITISKFHVFFNSINTILVACVVLIMYAFFAYLYYTNAHQHRKTFMDWKKPSNFSVLLSNIDHEKVTEEAIKKYFQGYEIEHILFTHQIKYYLKKLSKKSKLIALRILYQRRGQNFEANLEIQKLNKKISQIDQYLFKINTTLTPQLQKTVRTDKVIIKFKTVQQKHRFDLNYRKNFCQFFQQTFCNNSLIEINGHKIHTQNLGEPNEVLWQNFEITASMRLFRVLVGSLLSLVVLAASYLFAALITKLQQTHTGSSDYLLSILFSISVQVSNLIMEEIIQRLTEWQKRYTLTSKYRVMLVKNFLLYFLNTTIMPFSFFLFDWGTKSENDEMLNVFTVCCILNFQLPVPFVVNFIRIPHIVKFFMRRKMLKQGNTCMLFSGQNCLMTQMEANKYFERFDFELHSKFVKVIQIVSNAAFYAAVFPLGLVITMAGLVLTYWSSKIFLVKYCTIPKQSYRLGRLVNDITVFFPTILAFGYALNELMIPGKTEFNRIVPLIIGILTIPIGILFVMFGNKIAQKVISKRYEELNNNMEMDEKANHQQNHKLLVLGYRDLNPTAFVGPCLDNSLEDINVSNIEERLEKYAIEQGRRNSN